MRFHRRFRIAPGVTLNISRSGVGLSVGPRGFKYTIGPTGSRVTVGVPGSGMSYTVPISEEKRARAQAAEQSAGAAVTPPPTPGLFASADEKDFFRACRLYLEPDYVAAQKAFTVLLEAGVYRVESCFMAAISAALNRDLEEAVRLLSETLMHEEPPLPGDTGSLVAKYLPSSRLSLPVTRSTRVELPLSLASVPLLLSEVLQAAGDTDGAIDVLEQILDEIPGSRVLQLALAELYDAAGRTDDLLALAERAFADLRPAAGDAETEIVYYWGRALAARQMFEAAKELYSRALRPARGRNPELDKLLQYARADLYEQWGKTKQARTYFEKLYALDPGFLDVGGRIASLPGPKPRA